MKRNIVLFVVLILLLVASFNVGYNWGRWDMMDEYQELGQSLISVESFEPDSVYSLFFQFKISPTRIDTTWIIKPSN